MVFVADALGQWLVEQLADAGRKKLTELILGGEQERALRRAADAAVWATAEEMSPSGAEQTGQVAMVISEVFRDPVPAAPLAGPVMLLEGLRTGIAGQLAVLDDAELTGTGQSSADVLGVPGAVLAYRLTSHLVREIIVRGSGGGPLTPLASQLNHELTRLQIEGMFASLAEEIRGALARPDSGVMVAGRPLEEVTDPFVLEVHRPVQPEDAPPGLPMLPPYVPREHDEMLSQVVRAAVDCGSGIAVLVGGSSTGKTRACWEALAPLRDQDPPWRLWHPIDPARPDAAVRELPTIGPRTVVWLNEAQFYLDPAEAGMGERVAAGLRELLRDPGRAPVLVLATIWPGFWDALTARPVGGDDPHAQARELLVGHDITVPAAFTPAQLHGLSQVGDVRLAQAAAAAQEGQVIQFLAGAPELLARYCNAPPAVAALIHTAMDARRLGMGIGLPQAFLAAAAPGYLGDIEWDALGEDWLEKALAYTAVPCKGVRGPLTRIRPRPATSRATRTGSPGGGKQLADGQAGTTDMPLYRLADYLDQHGRQHRTEQIPPTAFWAAAAGHAFPDDQAALGDAAHDRGLYRAAAQLHKNAAAHGNRDAIFYLADTPPVDWAAAHVPVEDPRGVAWLLGRLWEASAQEQVTTLLHRHPSSASLDDPSGVAELLGRLRQAGAQEQVTTLASRAAAHVPLDHPRDVAGLLDALREAGAQEQVTTLLHRNPAAHVSLDSPRHLAELLGRLREAGAQEQVTTLASRAAAHVPLDHPYDVAVLLGRLQEAGAHEQTTTLASRAAGLAPVDDPRGVTVLLGRLRQAGAQEQVTTLASRAAAHVPLDHPRDVAGLLDALREAGAHDQVTTLLHRKPAADVSLDDPGVVALLLEFMREAGAHDQVTTLLHRNPAAHVSLDSPRHLAELLDGLRRVGAHDQVTTLLHRNPAAHVSLDVLHGVSWLLRELAAVGAHDQVITLLHRNPAAHVPLDDPYAVGLLLDRLRKAGAQEQVTTLASRAAAHVPLDDQHAVGLLLGELRKTGSHDQVTTLARRAAAHVPLDDPYEVATLLGSLREAAAQEQVSTLASRLPAAGMFELFIEEQGRQDRFRFGREADGSPAEPWSWEDLD